MLETDHPPTNLLEVIYMLNGEGQSGAQSISGEWLHPKACDVDTLP